MLARIAEKGAPVCVGIDLDLFLRSVEPYLKAGCDIGVDNVAGALEHSPAFACLRALKEAGTDVFVEATPRQDKEYMYENFGVIAAMDIFEDRHIDPDIIADTTPPDGSATNPFVGLDQVGGKGNEYIILHSKVRALSVCQRMRLMRKFYDRGYTVACPQGWFTRNPPNMDNFWCCDWAGFDCDISHLGNGEEYCTDECP